MLLTPAFSGERSGSARRCGNSHALGDHHKQGKSGDASVSSNGPRNCCVCVCARGNLLVDLEEDIYVCTNIYCKKWKGCDASH